MSNEYNFSELHNYIASQIDLGLTEVFFDEPWVLQKQTNKPANIEAQTRPHIVQEQIITNAQTQQSLFSEPIVATRTQSAFESATNLDAFYAAIKNEIFYAKEPALASYMGPNNPKLLLLLPSVKEQIQDAKTFFETPVGYMLSRLFASLNISQKTIGITYFFKTTARTIPPLIEIILKKMLTKELSFIKPNAMVVFGQPLFNQIFGKAKNFDTMAGNDLEFANVKTCALIDPYAMEKDKQLKWITWKVHIPRSTIFTKIV